MNSARQIILYRPEYESVRLIQCSPPSWMVELVMLEKALAYRVEELSFARGEHRTPEMLARNPRGTIPVLVDGDAVLWESQAIIEYLELTYPTGSGAPLLGADDITRARALNRLHESAALKRMGMELFAYLMRTPDGERDPAHVARLTAAFCDELGWWERYYSETAWAAGQEVSLADFAVFVYVATAVRLGLALTPELPHLQAMYERMALRPSVHATWPEAWKREPRLDALAQ